MTTLVQMFNDRIVHLYGMYPHLESLTEPKLLIPSDGESAIKAAFSALAEVVSTVFPEYTEYTTALGKAVTEEDRIAILKRFPVIVPDVMAPGDGAEQDWFLLEQTVGLLNAMSSKTGLKLPIDRSHDYAELVNLLCSGSAGQLRPTVRLARLYRKLTETWKETVNKLRKNSVAGAMRSPVASNAPVLTQISRDTYGVLNRMAGNPNLFGKKATDIDLIGILLNQIDVVKFNPKELEAVWAYLVSALPAGAQPFLPEITQLIARAEYEQASVAVGRLVRWMETLRGLETVTLPPYTYGTPVDMKVLLQNKLDERRRVKEAFTSEVLQSIALQTENTLKALDKVDGFTRPSQTEYAMYPSQIREVWEGVATTTTEPVIRMMAESIVSRLDNQDIDVLTGTLQRMKSYADRLVIKQEKAAE